LPENDKLLDASSLCTLQLPPFGSSSTLYLFALATVDHVTAQRP